jgi:segregation and condensation protein B
MFYDHVKRIVEGLLFIAGEPVPIKKLSEVLELDEDNVLLLLEQLRDDYHKMERGIIIIEVAGGYQFGTRPEIASYIEKMYKPQPSGLSQAALETLSIIAFKQPITRLEIESIRGVKIDSALHTLLERKLIKEVGRKEGLGRPILYGTTVDFLRQFGLKNLGELPMLPTIEVNEEEIDMELEEKESTKG